MKDSSVPLLRRVLRWPGRRLRVLQVRSASRCYFRSLEGVHRGRRGFVIGNGPSLRMEDLERLQGEICIASNKIYLAFEKTAWRPTYHTVMDPIVIGKIGAKLGDHIASTHAPEALVDAIDPRCRVHGLRYLGVVEGDPRERVCFSDNVGLGVYGGFTVTFENLQLARHLGLDPVYLLGCDHYYSGESNVKPADLTTHSGSATHFVPNYREPGEVSYAAPIREMTLAYQHAAEYARRQGWNLSNATRGGFLEVFPRTDLDRLLA